MVDNIKADSKLFYRDVSPSPDTPCSSPPQTASLPRSPWPSLLSLPPSSAPRPTRLGPPPPPTPASPRTKSLRRRLPTRARGRRQKHPHQSHFWTSGHLMNSKSDEWWTSRLLVNIWWTSRHLVNIWWTSRHLVNIWWTCGQCGMWSPGYLEHVFVFVVMRKQETLQPGASSPGAKQYGDRRTDRLTTDQPTNQSTGQRTKSLTEAL
jgi:hypothetical protein